VNHDIGNVVVRRVARVMTEPVDHCLVHGCPSLAHCSRRGHDPVP